MADIKMTVLIGGDEVGYGCWQSNPNITEWMKAGITVP